MDDISRRKFGAICASLVASSTIPESKSPSTPKDEFFTVNFPPEPLSGWVVYAFPIKMTTLHIDGPLHSTKIED